MPAKPIATLLKFGHPQMAAEAFLIDRDTGKKLFRDADLKGALEPGNTHSAAGKLPAAANRHDWIAA